jgi:transcriptional regulator with XRE-family HTH domain
MTQAQAKNVGSLLAKARGKKGLTLRDLAALTGIPFATIARVERGEYSEPAPDNLARLAEALELDPARIDRVGGNYLANSLPSVGTYFRSKEKASPEEIAEIEAAVGTIRRKYERRGRP